YGEARAANIGFPEVGKDAVVFGKPFGVGKRYVTTCRPSLPYAKEPHQVESGSLEVIQLPVADVVQRGRPPEFGGKFGQSNARIDLVQRWITRSSHDASFPSPIRMCVSELMLTRQLPKLPSSPD